MYDIRASFHDDGTNYKTGKMMAHLSYYLVRPGDELGNKSERDDLIIRNFDHEPTDEEYSAAIEEYEKMSGWTNGSR